MSKTTVYSVFAMSADEKTTLFGYPHGTVFEARAQSDARAISLEYPETVVRVEKCDLVYCSESGPRLEARNSETIAKYRGGRGA